MQRPARPKSAKGKVRPTPPTRPRPAQSLANTSSYTENSSRYASSTSTLRRGVSLRTTGSTNSSQSSAKRESYTKKKTENENRQPVDPSQLPEVSRPVSSLSRYDILPGISDIPGEAGSVSPVPSELELDLMSSFAQQMILDSAKMNNHIHSNGTPKKNPARSSSQKVAPKPRPPAMKSPPSDQHGPARKKARTTATVSVFNARGTSSKVVREPQDGEERIKLAIKLPDGSRVERYFSPNDTISDVMQFAQTKMRIPVKQCDIFSMLQVPKVLIKNWNQTIEVLGLRDRTVLYIDRKDEFLH